MLEARSGVSAKTGNPWMTQEMVIEYFEHESDRYPDRAVVTMSGQERIREAGLQEGDEVTVGFGHSAREYEGRWYNELRVYKVEKLGGQKKDKSAKASAPASSAEASSPKTEPETVKPSKAATGDDAGDDLPF